MDLIKKTKLWRGIGKKAMNPLMFFGVSAWQSIDTRFFDQVKPFPGVPANMMEEQLVE